MHIVIITIMQIVIIVIAIVLIIAIVDSSLLSHSPTFIISYTLLHLNFKMRKSDEPHT